jgi:hypothetical protein
LRRWILGLTVGLALAAGPARAADCASTPAELGEHLGMAWAAFGNMDLAEFATARDAASAALPCLTRTLTPQDAAAWHAVMALDAFAAEDTAATTLSLRAALDADPHFTLPVALAPEGHPLRQAFDDAVALPPSPRAAVALPSGWLLFVDGTRTVTRPTRRPGVYQWVDPAGKVQAVAYLGAGEPLPVVAGATLPPVPTPVRHRSTPLLIAAGGTAVVSAGLYAGAALSRGAFDATTTRADLAPLQARTNGFVVASAGVAVAAAGLGVVGVVGVPW